MIRVLIAEDQTLVRGALRALLELEEDLEVVAEVGRGDDVVDAAREHRPDVALLDIEMPGGDGIEAARALGTAVPACRAVILTTFGRPGFLRRAMEVGAAGFLVKDAPVAELARGIRAVMAGERIIDRELAAAALAIGAMVGWARSRDVGTAGDPKLDVFTYDVGAEVRAPRLLRDAPVSVMPFAGLGAGGRSYNHRSLDIDATHNLAVYGSAGAELAYRRVRVRLEARDYLSGLKPLVGGGPSTTGHDVVVMAGLRIAPR